MIFDTILYNLQADIQKEKLRPVFTYATHIINTAQRANITQHKVIKARQKKKESSSQKIVEEEAASIRVAKRGIYRGFLSCSRATIAQILNILNEQVASFGRAYPVIYRYVWTLGF